MLDGATGLPAHGADPCRTGIPNRGGSVDSCEDQGRLLPLAETEEIVEAAQPSGPGLAPSPRGRALQEQAARTSSTSARLMPHGMFLAQNPGPGMGASIPQRLHATRDEDRAMPEAGPYPATVGCAPLGLAGGIGVGERRLGSCHADGCPSHRRSNGEEQLPQR
jgi:hypothetical protein